MNTTRPSKGFKRRILAFTLMEMLVVIGIIGILAALTAPTIKNLGRGDVIGVALRQLNDDLNLARLRAINGRSPVYVVFMSRQSDFGIAQMGFIQSNYFATNITANRFLGGQLSSYALYAGRTLGDQPGQPTGHYLTDWKPLPRGVYFDTNIFYNPGIFFNAFNGNFLSNVPQGVAYSPLRQFVVPNDIQLANPLPFLTLPYIVFDSQGRLSGRSSDILLPVTTGALNFQTDPPAYTNYTVADPATSLEGRIAGAGGSPLDIVGNLQPGVAYVVLGIGSVLYNGTTYLPGQVFYGVSGFPNMSSTAIVREVNGVQINWLTGRSRIHRPESL